MNRIDNGGPAFPKADDRDPLTGQGIRQGSDGMSLRDWFAGQALAAIINSDGAQYFDRPNDHAKTAYAHADAMLKARQP